MKWWKYLTIALLLYTAIMGLLGHVPRLAILNETERNLYFHVPMWFGMTIILLASVIFFSVLQTRLVIHEVLIGFLVVTTTPVTLMLLTRAALHRDRLEGSTEVPPPVGQPKHEDQPPAP